MHQTQIGEGDQFMSLAIVLPLAFFLFLLLFGKRDCLEGIVQVSRSLPRARHANALAGRPGNPDADCLPLFKKYRVCELIIGRKAFGPSDQAFPKRNSFVN